MARRSSVRRISCTSPPKGARNLGAGPGFAERLGEGEGAADVSQARGVVGVEQDPVFAVGHRLRCRRSGLVQPIPGLLRERVQRIPKAREVHRLGQVVAHPEGAEALRLRVGGDQQGATGLRAIEEREAVAVGQPHIDDEGVEAPAPEKLAGLPERPRLRGPEAAARERGGEGPAQVAFVFDDEHARVAWNHPPPGARFRVPGALTPRRPRDHGPSRLAPLLLSVRAENRTTEGVTSNAPGRRA